MTTGEERRKFARLDLALNISYRVIERDPTPPVDPRETISSDISMGGVRLMMPSRIENGTMLELEIYLGEDDSVPIKAEGEVVWQSRISKTSFETGVMIKDMASDNKSRFMRFVFDQMSKMVSG